MRAYMSELRAGSGIATIMSAKHKFAPQIYLDAPDDTAAADAAKAAAEKAAAEKAAKEKAEAELQEKLKGLSDSEAKLLKENMAKKEELAAKEKALAELQAKLKNYDGIDLDKVKALVTAAEKAEAEKLEAEKQAAIKAGDFERVKQMMADEHAKEVEKLKAEKAERENALNAAQAQINELNIGSAFANSAFVKDKLVLTPAKARLLYGGNFEVENGVMVGYDKPKGQPNRTKMVDSSGRPLSFDVVMTKLVEADPEKDTLLRGNLKPGTGGKPNDARVAADPQKKLTGVARIQAALDAQAKA